MHINWSRRSKGMQAQPGGQASTAEGTDADAPGSERDPGIVNWTSLLVWVEWT
jgi:hypothetical protein